jgi:hypothetical protein
VPLDVLVVSDAIVATTEDAQKVTDLVEQAAVLKSLTNTFIAIQNQIVLVLLLMTKD